VSRVERAKTLAEQNIVATPSESMTTMLPMPPTPAVGKRREAAAAKFASPVAAAVAAHAPAPNPAPIIVNAAEQNAAVAPLAAAIAVPEQPAAGVSNEVAQMPAPQPALSSQGQKRKKPAAPRAEDGAPAVVPLAAAIAVPKQPAAHAVVTNEIAQVPAARPARSSQGQKRKEPAASLVEDMAPSIDDDSQIVVAARMSSSSQSPPDPPSETHAAPKPKKKK
jgi:hypothetical protein